MSAVLAACGPQELAEGPTAPCVEAAQPGRPFGVRCAQLVDESGRVVFLRGVNARIAGLFDVTFEDGREALEPVPAFDASDARTMRDFGFDALRLPINWSGVEPTENGGFDASYLERLRGVVDIAASEDLLVLVDFHQDAYSKEIGEDGAPLWAIDPAPAELLEGPLDDLEERRLSGAVLAAFDTFFGAGARGTELRERYTRMAQHVVAGLAEHPAVIGFEIFNEPVADDTGVARLNALAYPVLRDTAPDKLYVFEPPAIRNFTDQATLAGAPLGPMTAYAPHIYTLALGDGQDAALHDKSQLLRSNENARAEADSWQAPLLITEWGASPHASTTHQYLQWQTELQQQMQASSFFWLWKERSQGHWGCFDFDDAEQRWLPREAMRRALATIRPARIAGWPRRFGYHAERREFELEFWSLPDVSAPHWIAVAPVLEGRRRVWCDEHPTEASEVQPGVHQVACGAGDGALHRLRVTLGD
jgi:endoglycosylceramidase